MPIITHFLFLFFCFCDTATHGDSSSKVEEKFTHFHLLETKFHFLSKAFSTYTVNQPRVIFQVFHLFSFFVCFLFFHQNPWKTRLISICHKYQGYLGERIRVKRYSRDYPNQWFPTFSPLTPISIPTHIQPQAWLSISFYA